MRQFDQAAVKEFLMRTRGSVASREELSGSDGSRLVLERHPAPGVVERLSEVRADGSVRDYTREYAAAAEPPAEYPAGLPFLPHRAVGVAFLPADGIALTWETSESPAAVFAEVMQACDADGWRAPEHAGAGLGQTMASGAMAMLRGVGLEFGVHRRFRGDRQRLIQVSGQSGGSGIVTLAEMARAAEDPPTPVR